MKTAIVTGGAGFIGSYICRSLIENEVCEQIVILDHFGRYVDSLRSDFVDFRPYRFQGITDRILIERGEAKYYSVISDIIHKYKPDYFFHLASSPLAKLHNLMVEEAQEGSVVSTSNILEILGRMKACDEYDIKRFVYISSSMVYGDWQKPTADEEHPLDPKDLYGTMKLAGEVVTHGLSNYYDIKSTIIRPSAVYGPYDMNRRVTQIFIQKAINGEELNIQGADGKLDFSYVKDVAEGIVLAATSKNGIGETFNITGGRGYTLLELAQILKKHFPDLKYRITEREAFRPRRGTLDTEKARRLLGYTPKYTLEKGIAEYLKTCRDLLVYPTQGSPPKQPTDNTTAAHEQPISQVRKNGKKLAVLS